jgi:DNA-binding transcriptional ArsR family regulator
MAGKGMPSFEFVVTPRFDVFYALYSLTSNTSSAHAHWREKARQRLPGDFERGATRIAPLAIFWPLLADSLQSAPGEISFEEILSTLAAAPSADLQRNILSGIFHDRAVVDELIARKTSLAEVIADGALAGAELLTHFGLKPYNPRSPSVVAMSALLARPESFRDELSLLLRRFWQSGFKRDWSALEPRLRVEAFRMSDRREDLSTADLARELNLPVEFDDDKKEMRPKTGTRIGYDQIDRCYIVPSAFNSRRWWAKYETKSSRNTLYFPIVREPSLADAIVADESRAADADRKSRVEINAESVFRALGDTTRYAIASILARTPSTSAELARTLNVSKPTITHHVQALRAAGLLSEIPEGGATRLSLREDTVASLSGAAVEQLFASTGDLSLSTTRKRRNG